MCLKLEIYPVNKVKHRYILNLIFIIHIYNVCVHVMPLESVLTLYY